MYPEKIHFGAIMERGRAEAHTAPFPTVGLDEILIKLEAINICTADYHQWMGFRDHQGFPMAAGHEFAGRICQCGKNVYKGFELGAQVVAMWTPCGACPNCLGGHPHDCLGVDHGQRDENGFLGFKRFADYTVVNQRSVFLINDPLPGPVAACAEPLSTVVNGFHRVNLQPASDVAIIGAGPMGLLTAITAKAWECRVFLTECDPARVERARSLNMFHVIDAAEGDSVQAVREASGGGVEVAIPIIGSTDAYTQAYGMLRDYFGSVMLWSADFPEPQMSFSANHLHYSKHSIVGAYGATNEEWQLACKLLSRRIVDPTPILDGRIFALKDIQKAYEAAAEKDSFRITVDPSIV